MSKPQQYYTLAVKIDGKYSPEYGSYVRSDVVAEKSEYTSHGLYKCKIIATAPEQAAIMAAITELNLGV